MAIVTGYSKYECAKCGKVEFLRPREDTVLVGRWHEHRWVNMDGIEVEELMCDACEDGYKRMRSEVDAAHNTYVNAAKEEK